MNIFIVHGYRADPSKHWFPWLSQKLSDQGHSVTVITLPNPQTPQLTDWVQAVTDAIGAPDENTVIITHSLGGYTALSYLAQISEDWKLAGLILVAGFPSKLATIPDLDDFLSTPLTSKTLEPTINNTDTIIMIYSDNDASVPPEDSIELGKQLGAQLIEIPRGGHFLDREGFVEFPELLTVTEKIISEHIPQHNSEHIPENTCEHIPKSTCEHIPQHISHNPPQHTSQQHTSQLRTPQQHSSQQRASNES